MQKHNNWTAASLCVVIFGWTGITRCQAEDLTSPVTITAGYLAQLRLAGGHNLFILNCYDQNNNEAAGFFLKDNLAHPPASQSQTYPWQIRPGAPANTLVITPDGRVGVQTNSPDVNSQMEARSLLANGVLLRRVTPDNELAGAHYFRAENSLGVFRSGVQSSGDAQFGAFTAGNGLNLLAGGTSKVTVNSSGQVSIGNPPPAVGTNALATSTGAVLTAGGVWTNNSSRAAKQDIEPITSEQARDTVRALQPVSYRYKNEPDEQYVGFIAEDVPELVATRNRKGLTAMDITAVLTKVVQDQDREQSEDQQIIAKRQELLVAMSERLLILEQKFEDRNTTAQPAMRPCKR